MGGVVVNDVAVSLKAVASTSPGWPKCGQSPGHSMAAVAAVHNGGSGKRWGTSHIVTFVTFQLRLLNLATCGCLLLINSNYH